MNKDLSLNAFTAIDDTGQTTTYIAALEAFDKIEQLQELKHLEREIVRPGSAILDVGCGFGLETVSLARRSGSRGTVCGIDKSEQFIAEARRRAREQRLSIDYRVGDAARLPYADDSFDHVRAERLLIYFDDVETVLAGMRRVMRPTGVLALIEPEFCTTTVNVSDRALVRRVMAHEAETAVAQSWLPGRLAGMLADLGFADISIASRVVVLPQQLAADYFWAPRPRPRTEAPYPTASLPHGRQKSGACSTPEDCLRPKATSCSPIAMRKSSTVAPLANPRAPRTRHPARLHGPSCNAASPAFCTGTWTVSSCRQLSRLQVKWRIRSRVLVMTPGPKVLSAESLILSVPQDGQSGDVEEVESAPSLASRILIRFSSSSMRSRIDRLHEVGSSRLRCKTRAAAPIVSGYH